MCTLPSSEDQTYTGRLAHALRSLVLQWLTTSEEHRWVLTSSPASQLAKTK